MKTLKLSNKIFFLIFFSLYFFISSNLNSNEPIDIWDIENIKKKNTVELENSSESMNN